MARETNSNYKDFELEKFELWKLSLKNLHLKLTLQSKTSLK